MIENDRPSCDSAITAPTLPIMMSKVDTISPDSDKSRRGDIATAYTRKVPTKAEIRGSRPLALPDGGLRRITAKAASNINAIVDNRIAIWIRQAKSKSIG